MTLIRKTPIALVLAGSMIMHGCALKQMVQMSKDQQLTVTPSPLEVHGDSVKFEVSALLPVKMLKKNKIYAVNPSYKYGDQRINLPVIEFNSADFPKATTEQPKINKTLSFGYKPEIGNGDLVIQGTAYNITKSKSKSTEELPISTGIITTSRLTKDVYYTAYADHGYNNKEELMPVTVNFFFDQGSSKLTNKEQKGVQAKNLDAFLAGKNVSRTVTVIGFHSPEGSEAKNSKLADDRARIIEKYYKDRMKFFDKKASVDSIKFVTKGVFQDWEPLKKELQTSAKLDDKQKSEILAIINGPGAFLDKEKSLQKLPHYKTLIKDVYPVLRTAKTEILKVKPKKSDLQIQMLTKEICEKGLRLDTLSYEELAYAATLTPILTEKEAIYSQLIKKKDTWDGHNNLGAVYIEMASKAVDAGQKDKSLDKAINQCELSIKGKDNAQAHTNLAVAYLMKGMRDKAIEEIVKAEGMEASIELKKGIMGVKGVLEIKQGKYNEAVQSLSKASETNDVLYNLALANLLRRDFEAAKKGFESLKSADANNAWVFYLAAVTASRMNNEGEVTANLKKAVSLDKKLSEKAVNDLEFAQYRNSENFKNALK
ncbi:MAG: OmpA family protein [Cytophagaceae bacterium]